MGATDLFGAAPDPIRGGGYAGNPGQGPRGETCDSCANVRVHRQSRNYYKCALVRATSGPGTDIRLKTPACQYWTGDSNDNEPAA